MPRLFVFGVFQRSTSVGRNLNCDCSSFLEFLAGMDHLLARGRSPGHYELPLDGGRLSSTLGLPCDAGIADRATRRAACRV